MKFVIPTASISKSGYLRLGIVCTLYWQETPQLYSTIWASARLRPSVGETERNVEIIPRFAQEHHYLRITSIKEL
jgi:hypothetical protein